MTDRVLRVVFAGDAKGAIAAARQVETGLAATGSKLSSIGGTLTKGVTLPLGLAAFKSVSLAGDFEKTMNTMKAVAGVPQPELEKLSDLAVKLGADTVFSANEAGGAMLELSKAGISTSDIMGGALKNALDLATAGDLDLATAATTASTAMNIFNLNGKESQTAVDALAGAANASSANVDDLAMALSQGGMAAANAGLSIEETTATLAAFADAGIRGSDAGTSLKSFMLNLIPTSAKAQAQMESLGLSFEDSNGQILSMTEIADELQEGLKGLTDAEQQAALKVMFGTDAFRAASVVMEEGADGLNEYMKQTSEVGTAAEVAAAKMKGWPGILEQLKGSLETVGLIIGQVLIPPLSVLADGLTKVLNAFTSLPSGTQTAIVALGAVAAATGPVMWSVGKLITTWTKLQALLKAQVVIEGVLSMNRLKLAVAETIAGVNNLSKAIKLIGWAGVVVGIAEAEKRLISFSDTITRDNPFAEIGLWVHRLRSGDVGGVIDDIFNRTSEGADDAADRVKWLGKSYKDGFQGAAEAAGAAAIKMDVLKMKAAKAARTFANFDEADLNTWKGEVTGNLGVVSGAFDSIATKAKLTSRDIIKAFKKQIESVINFGNNLKTLAKEGLSEFAAQTITKMGPAGAAIAEALVDGPRSDVAEFGRLLQKGTNLEANFADQTLANMGYAANGMQQVVNKANEITSAIGRIPTSKIVSVSIMEQTISTGSGKTPEGRATGGSVQPRGTYLVGEKGPELLRLGGRSGSIVPNHELDTRGGDTYNIYTDGTQDGRKVAQVVRMELENDRKRNARYDRTRGH